MLTLLLLAAAAATGGADLAGADFVCPTWDCWDERAATADADLAGADLAGAMARSCAGIDDPAWPASRPSPTVGFCATVARTGAGSPDGSGIMDRGFWSEYAADEAARFLEGWDFYRRYGDAGTLEISPSVSGAGGTFPPDVNVTVRFDHSWPGPGGGRYEQTATMEKTGPWEYWFEELYGPPYVIDGRAAHGSTVTCIEGFYLDTDADACLPFTPCPAGSALYDGVCITDMACRGLRGSYLIDGETWR